MIATISIFGAGVNPTSDSGVGNASANSQKTPPPSPIPLKPSVDNTTSTSKTFQKDWQDLLNNATQNRQFLDKKPIAGFSSFMLGDSLSSVKTLLQTPSSLFYPYKESDVNYFDQNNAFPTTPTAPSSGASNMKKDVGVDDLTANKDDSLSIDPKLFLTPSNIINLTGKSPLQVIHLFFDKKNILSNISINIDPKMIDFYNLYKVLIKKYGDPVIFNPKEAIWKNGNLSIRLTHSLTLQYNSSDPSQIPVKAPLSFSTESLLKELLNAL